MTDKQIERLMESCNKLSAKFRETLNKKQNLMLTKLLDLEYKCNEIIDHGEISY